MNADGQFLKAVAAEVKRARELFPGANATNAALVEEVGEVSTALMFKPWNAVVAEAVQVAAMACRLAVEGDATFKDWRWKKIHEHGTRYGTISTTPTSPSGEKMSHDITITDEYKAERDEFENECIKLREQVKTLREALKALADIPIEDFGWHHRPEQQLHGWNGYALKAGHVLTARAALKESE